MIDFLQTSSFSPLVVCGLCLAFGYLLRTGRWNVPWKALSLVLIGTLAVAAAAYLVLPVLAEDTETDIAAIASLATRGIPIYPAPDAAARYILLYGPLTYLAHVPIYAALGASLFSFKLLGFLGFVATVIGLYQICRAFAGPGPSLIGCGCACLVLLRYVPVPFWGRIDSLILGIVVISLWVALRGPTWLVLLSTVLAMGILPNLKFTAVVYLLPTLAIIWMRRGRGQAIGAALLGLLLVPLPFLFPEVSFSNYVWVLSLNGRHGLESKILLRNFQYAPIFLAPVLLLYFSRRTQQDSERRRQTVYLVILVFSMTVSSVFGAKAGAGSYHLLPYLAPLVHLYFWIRVSSPAVDADRPFSRFAVAWLMAMLIFSAGQVHTLLQCLRYSPLGAQAISEIAAAEQKYRGRVLAVGVGDDFLDPRTRYAFIPVQYGQPYPINGSSIRDMQFGGTKMPKSTLTYLARCGTRVWLIPAGQKPFTAKNTYFTEPHPAFDDDFRSVFLSRYTRAETGGQFDTWVCRN